MIPSTYCPTCGTRIHIDETCPKCCVKPPTTQLMTTEKDRTLQILEANYRELVEASGIDFDASSHPDRCEYLRKLNECLRSLYIYANANGLEFDAGWGESVRRRVEEVMTIQDKRIRGMLSLAASARRSGPRNVGQP